MVFCTVKLTQVVPTYTHVTPKGNNTLIDLALLADESNFLSCVTVPPSDHLGVAIVLKWKSLPRTSHTTSRCAWMFNNADFYKASDIIQETDWDSLLFNDLDHSVELWTM